MDRPKSYVGCYWVAIAVIAVFVILAVRAYNDVRNFFQTVKDFSHIQDHQPNDLDLTLPKLDQMFKADPEKAEATLADKSIVMTGKLVGYQTPKGEFVLILANKGSKSRANWSFTWPAEWPDSEKPKYKMGADMFCRGTFEKRDKSGDYEFFCMASTQSNETWTPAPKPTQPPRSRPKVTPSDISRPNPVSCCGR